VPEQGVSGERRHGRAVPRAGVPAAARGAPGGRVGQQRPLVLRAGHEARGHRPPQPLLHLRCHRHEGNTSRQQTLYRGKRRTLFLKSARVYYDIFHVTFITSAPQELSKHPSSKIVSSTAMDGINMPLGVAIDPTCSNPLPPSDAVRQQKNQFRGSFQFSIVTV